MKPAFQTFRSLLLMLWLIQGTAGTVAEAGSVVISEFAANNSNGLQDENGDYSDWIELCNTGTNAVNLDGWSLTDSSADLTKWRFPATNLPPSGYLVVFASGKNRAVAGAPLHTSFKLDAGGEYLALVMPDGVTIASEYAPQYPPQYADITYGVAQDLLVTRFVSNTSPARVFVPTNGTLGTSWVAVAFDDSSWRRGTNGVGYETYVPGFAVRNIRANVGVCDMGTADSVLNNPAQQAAVFTENRAVVNYLNTGTGDHFGNNNTFPGFTINVDENNYVTEATGIITIPTAGNWTFGVNSDDGFRATIGSYSLSYPGLRGASDTLATFTMAAGEYPVQLVFYECSGGSELEFFAAAGLKSSYDATFRLVGDTANGGLAVKSLPVGSGNGPLRPLIKTDVEAQMYRRASSAYVRFPFTVANPALFSSLTLRMKYNDGFVAWLNGVEVARRNAPASPQWNSTASTSRPTTSAVVFENIDLSSRLGLLQSGGNVLTIHGLNDSTNSTGFLILAELVENKILGLTNRYFGVPTPGEANSLDSYAVVDNLKFTPGRGWFENTNILVTITSATPGITIRYTTNGSAPSPTNGLLYSGPVRVASTIALRAVGFREGFEPTEVETHSYIFLEQVQNQSTNVSYVGGSSGNYTLNPAITQNPLYRDNFKSNLLSIPTLSITMTWEDLFGPNGINANTGAEGVAWERPCSLEYMRPDGEKGFNLNCGIRLQGGVSRSAMPKHGLRVLFKTIYGPGKLHYPLYADSSVEEFDTLTLHAGFNDHWLWGGTPAVLHRDQWCRDAQNAMGGYGPHGTYVHLYLNGIYWGLYNIGEKGDASYAAHYLGGEKEEYDAVNSDELIDGTSEAWNAMHAIANAGITTDQAYTNLAQYLDIPNFIDYMLMNFYAANTDWPGHNWNAARRRLPGAGYHFFSWDAEWTFGIGNDVNTDRTGVSDGSPGRLHNALRAHPEFRREFGDHVQRHLFNGGALTPVATAARWNKRSTEIEGGIVCEMARWVTGSDPSTWRTAESQVRSWFPQRTAILLNQLRNAGLYPQLNAPAFTPLGGLVPPGYPLAITNPNASGTIYYTLDGTDPRLWGGAIAPSARLYTAPVILSNAISLRARVRDGTQWSALVEATFYVVQDYGGLQVTEIMYHPPNAGFTSGDELEFLELKNTGTNTLDLSGLRFTDGITFAFTNGTQLAPGQFFVLARNASAFSAKYPGVSVNGIYTGKLDNGGEKLVLAHLLGTNVFSFSYNNQPPWPITPDGYNFSLVRANLAGAPEEPASWRPSANLGGSPGADDPAVSIPPIVINEILTRSDLPSTDAIELFNPTGSDVNIGGWFLSDDSAQPKEYRMASNTVIPAQGYVVFTEADFNPNPGIPPSFGLSSLGESLYLFSGDANTNLTGYSQSFDYGAAASGVSFGRYVLSTGQEEWPAQSAVTLGANNARPRVGPIIINELMYHPAEGYDEFVELYNNSDSAVALYDASFPTNRWKLSGLGYTFSNTVSMPPASYLLLVPMDPVQFRAKYSVPWSVQIVGPYTGILQDSGERLRLERPDAPLLGTNGVVTVPYIVVDEVRYNDKWPWPTAADGDGPSLQRRAPSAYGNEPTNWFASGITPGALNTYNEPPICTLDSPTNGAMYIVPANVPLTATASDPDGVIVAVEFYEGEIKLGEAAAPPYSMLWVNAPSGTQTITAKARDNRLGISSSTPVTITVSPPPIGSGVGLSAEYYDNVDFTGTVVRRTDPVVNFDWGSGAPAPGIGADTFSVRWLGRVQPRFTESYTFYTISDDGVRLWVNNQLLINNWTDHGQTEDAGIIALQAGNLYDIRMEMYDGGSGATAKLLWSSPSVAKEVIPSTQLYLPAPSNLPPAVVLTGPATGAVFVAGNRIEIIGTAADTDGTVAKIEFFAGTTKLGEATNASFTFPWLNASAGSYALSAVAVDNVGARGTSAPVSITVRAGFITNVTLVSTGAVWKYRDRGEDLGSAWSALGDNDSAWATGAAELGYGDGDEQTVIGYGSNPNAKFITTYFRRSFSVSNLALFSSLKLRVLRDDGVIVYLNGSEIYRNNLPDGPATYFTTATNDVEGVEEAIWRSAVVNAGYLVPGNNVIAAEVHQFSAQSSDLSFDLELLGEQTFIAPYLITPPQPQSVTEGDNVMLSVTAGGTAPLSYQWRFNGAELPEAANASLRLTNVQNAQQGYYQVIISNLAGLAVSSNILLTVRPPVLYPVSFTQQPQGVLLRGSTNVLSYGQTFSNYVFSAGVTGTAPIRFQWQKNGADIPGATNSTFTVFNASIADEGAYTVLASNVLGPVASAPASLVIAVNPAILRQPQSLTVVTGSTATFMVSARGYPYPLGYRWKRDADSLTNMLVANTNCSLTLNNLALTNGGLYVAIVTNSRLSTPFAISSNVYLTIVVPPTNQVANPRSNLTFTVTASAGNYTSKLRYQWQFNGVNLTNATNASLTISNLQGSHLGTYTVQVINPLNQVASFSADLLSFPVSFAQQPQSVVLRGSHLASDYGQTGSNVTFSVAVTGSTPISFQWRRNGLPLPGATGSALTLYDVSLAEEGIYTVVASNVLGAVDSAPASLSIQINPVILQHPQSLTVVTGSTVSLSVIARGQPLPLGYRWKRDADTLTNFVVAETNCTLLLSNVDLSNSGAYTVIATNSAYSIPFAASSNAYLTVVIPPVDQRVGVGSNVTFAINAKVGGHTSKLRYQWQFNRNNLPGATNVTLSLTNVQLSQAGTYTVIVTNPANMPASFAAALAVLPPAESDADGDGMADAWEIAHHLQPLDPTDANLDPDHDGMTNLQEYLAGTDPEDAQSYLKVEQISAGDGTCLLRFLAVSNKTYSIVYQDALISTNWLKLADTPALSSNRLETVTDTNGTAIRFYRLATPALR